MPELPEAETVRRDIVGHFVGDRLLSLSVTGARTVRRHPTDALRSLEGQMLSGVGRHGKYLLFQWADGQVLVGHLRMSGQLRWAGPGEALVAHTHAVFLFATAGELRFVDPRTFGELYLLELVTPSRPPAGVRAGAAGVGTGAASGLWHLGPDALEVQAPYLSSALAGRRAPLKALLVDQRVVAGIGNIYADEICFAAGVRGDRPAGSLTVAEVRRLAKATRRVLEAAIEARGSTLPDLGYRDLSGRPGEAQSLHRVYGRLGQPCFSCGRPIARPRFGARSAFLCPKCQH